MPAQSRLSGGNEYRISDTAHQIDQLLTALEGENLEFKEAKNKYDFGTLAKYCAALANQGGGKMVLGVTDKRPRRVVGTQAFSQIERMRLGLIEALHVRVEVDEVRHPLGRVLVITVPARPVGVPIRADGVPWSRRGDSLVAMEDSELRAVYGEIGHDLSADVVQGLEIKDLDADSVEAFRQRWIAKSGSPALRNATTKQLLADAEALVDGGVTLAGLVLFGSRPTLRKHLPQAEVVVEYRSSEESGPAQQRKEYQAGFFSYYEDLWNTLNLRNDVQHYQDGLFVLDVPTFDERSIREAVLNAVSHRDYRLGASVFVRQYARRIVVESPGGFPPGIDAGNILERQYPRNRRIADIFSKCGLVERSGQGMDLIFEASIRQSKRLPDFGGSDQFQFRLTLDGAIQDPAFIRFLERVAAQSAASFSTLDLVVLDHIRRETPVPDEAAQRMPALLDNGIVERINRGRGRRYVLSRRFYQFIGIPGLYTRKRGLDRETNKALLVKHIDESRATGARMETLGQVLPALSRNQLQVLVRELSRSGRIHHHGTTRAARWYPGSIDPDCDHSKE